MAAKLRSLSDAGPLLVYVIRLLAEGGATARAFVDQLVCDIETSMTAAVVAGSVRSSIDETARARYLVTMSLGTLTIDLAMNPRRTQPTAPPSLRPVARTIVPPTEYAT